MPMPAAPVTSRHATSSAEQTQNRIPVRGGVRFYVCWAEGVTTGFLVATRCARLRRAGDRHYPGCVLELRGDPIELTAALVDIPSESRDEARIADEVEAALRAQTPGFEVIRNGNAVLARTSLHRPSRVLLAGHLDTVPAAENLPSRLADGQLHGCGTADMKSGDAVFLHLAATVAEPVHDLTPVSYTHLDVYKRQALGRRHRINTRR